MNRKQPGERRAVEGATTSSNERRPHFARTASLAAPMASSTRKSSPRSGQACLLLDLWCCSLRAVVVLSWTLFHSMTIVNINYTVTVQSDSTEYVIVSIVRDIVSTTAVIFASSLEHPVQELCTCIIIWRRAFYQNWPIVQFRKGTACLVIESMC